MTARKTTKRPKKSAKTSSGSFTPVITDVAITEMEIDVAIAFSHLVLGLNPRIPPSIAMSVMMELLYGADGVTDETALQAGQMLAETVLTGHSPNESTH